MARNSEKAMTALARWRQLQLKEQGKLNKERRPFLASEEYSLRRAERWRHEVTREIAKKVTQIQNAGLGEFKIRDLNDEINKLLREKSHWEDRIVELGGQDYKKIGPHMLDRQGEEAQGNRGYKYFGAAKDLPGVRELFEQEPPLPPYKTRGDLMKLVDVAYYGYLDEEDGVLVAQERKCEKEAIKKKVEEWKNNLDKKSSEKQVALADELMDEHCFESSDEDNVLESKRFIAHVVVPSQEEVEMALLEKKKQDLLRKYVSSELLDEEREVRDLLGKS